MRRLVVEPYSAIAAPFRIGSAAGRRYDGVDGHLVHARRQLLNLHSARPDLVHQLRHVGAAGPGVGQSHCLRDLRCLDDVVDAVCTLLLEDEGSDVGTQTSQDCPQQHVVVHVWCSFCQLLNRCYVVASALPWTLDSGEDRLLVKDIVKCCLAKVLFKLVEEDRELLLGLVIQCVVPVDSCSSEDVYWSVHEV